MKILQITVPPGGHFSWRAMPGGEIYNPDGAKLTAVWAENYSKRVPRIVEVTRGANNFIELPQELGTTYYMTDPNGNAIVINGIPGGSYSYDTPAPGRQDAENHEYYTALTGLVEELGEKP